MRVGIVTLVATGDLNFGNSLQTYALQRFISKYADTVETFLSSPWCLHGYEHLSMNQIIPSNSAWEKLIFYLKLLLNYGNVRDKYCSVREQLLKQSAFHSFEKRHIRWAEKRLCNNPTDVRLNLEYDFFVVGSDQIWINPSESAFLTFASPEKRIAYAPSFGRVNDNLAVQQRYYPLIRGMAFCSCREEEGAKFISKVRGEDIPVLCDPTALLNAEQWSEVTSQPDCEMPTRYILTYFLGNVGQSFKEKIWLLSEERNLPVVALGDISHPEWYALGPAEFLWLVAHAETVFTDSFHGSLFSILFHRPLQIYDEHLVNSGGPVNRIDTLLHITRLQNRKYLSGDEVRLEDLLNQSYVGVDEIFEAEREKSDYFMRKALGIDGN